MTLKEIDECKIKGEKTIKIGDKVYIPEIREQVENPVTVSKIIQNEDGDGDFVFYFDEKTGKSDVVNSSKLEKSDYKDNEDDHTELSEAYESFVVFNKIKEKLDIKDLDYLNSEELALMFVDYMKDKERNNNLIADDFMVFLKERWL